MSPHGTTLSNQSIFSDRRLSLNLLVAENGQVDVQSCEIVSTNFRNRTSFPNFHSLESVVVEQVSNAVHQALQDLEPGPLVVSLPDFLVELPGLVLSGAHLMVTKARNGVRSAIFRFKEFLGAVNTIFVADIGFNGSPVLHNEQLATQVLTDICLPVLNLCNQVDTMLRDAFCPVHSNLRDKTRELEFQTELLKRFVFNSATGTPDAPQNYLTDMHPEQNLLS